MVGVWQKNIFQKSRKKSLTFSVIWAHNIMKGGNTLKQDDVQLVHAIRDGDSTAFTTLVEKYKKAGFFVYGVILPKVRDFHQAQDLTSETFVTAYLSIESLDAPEKVGRWLCGIARNLANKWLYREKRDDLSLEGLLESTSSRAEDSDKSEESAHKAHLLQVSAAEKTPDETAEHAELRQLLWRCLLALPDISSEVLILSYLREMKSAEIAKFLGISQTAVTTRLSEARKRLKKEMIRMVKNTIEDQPLAEDFTEQVVTEAIKRGERYLADGNWKKCPRTVPTRRRRSSGLRPRISGTRYGRTGADRGAAFSPRWNG